jgi:hypothetical protein
LLFLKSPFHWWYEDDPWQYAIADSIPNPVRIFADPAVMQGFGSGASLVPVQLLSYWLDLRLFGKSPLLANLHSLFWLLVAAVLFFVLLLSLTGDRWLSAVFAGFWVCLPSTISVHLYLSARHYLEGAAWALAACWAAHELWRTPAPRRSLRPWLWTVLLAATIAAILCKEIYGALVLCYLFVGAILRRRFAAALGAGILATAYAVYRAWMLGNGAKYPVAPLPASKMLDFLRIVPYTLTSNAGGYLLYGGLAVGGVLLLLFHWRGAWKGAVLTASLVAAGLASIYPAAAAVLETFRTPGTWYRTSFAVHAVVLLGIACLLARLSRIWRVAACALFAAALLPGTLSAERWWSGRFERSEAEGRFYLANPGRLVYSEEDALWFLSGVDRLYRVSQSHFISRALREEQISRDRAREFTTIWRFRAGRFIEDPGLFGEIRGPVGRGSPSPPF